MSTQRTAYEKMKPSSFITESRAAKFLGVEESKMEKLRQNEALPFIKIDRMTRMYHFPELFKWLFSRKTVLGAETKNEQG